MSMSSSYLFPSQMLRLPISSETVIVGLQDCSSVLFHSKSRRGRAWSLDWLSWRGRAGRRRGKCPVSTSPVGQYQFTDLRQDREYRDGQTLHGRPRDSLANDDGRKIACTAPASRAGRAAMVQPKSAFDCKSILDG